MSVKYGLIIIVVLFAIGACRKNVISPVQISGVWIESKNSADTLVFGYDNLLELKRGKMATLRSAFSAPGHGSGLYSYRFTQDSIALNYLLLSTHVSKSFPFKMEGNKLYIGDFYKNPGSGSLLTFDRMR